MKRFSIIILLACFAALFSCSKETASSEIKVDGSTEYNLSESQVVLNIRLSGSALWEYSLGDASSWISEKSRADMSVSLTVSGNTSTQSRTAEIVFTAGTSSAKVTVNQKGKDIEPEITLSPSDLVEVDAAAHTATVTVTYSLGDEWEAEVAAAAADWLGVSRSGASFAIDIAANPLEEERSGKITVYAPSKSNCLAVATVNVLQEALDVHYDPECLSASGTSNCYMIFHKGEYSFDATVRGNGKASEGLSAPAALAPDGAKLVWQSSTNMIESVSYADGVITFVARRVFGNAVIAATSSDGTILWSWHIWFPSEAVSSMSTYNGAEVMGYNLGALNSTPGALSSYGTLYQWGRKDPFPGAPRASGGDVSMVNAKVYDIDGNEVSITHCNATTAKITDTGLTHLQYSVQHPTVCIGNAPQYMTCRSWLPEAELDNALWGNPLGDERTEGEYNAKGSKSYYDPCPVGWRVPHISVFQHFTKTGGMAWATGTTEDLVWGDLGGNTEVQVVDIDKDGKISLTGDWKNGWHFYINVHDNTKYLYFPATTRYDGQYAMLMGSMVGLWGNYWFNVPSDGGLAQAMAFGIKDYNAAADSYSITVSPLATGSQADAYAVRCIKE